MSLVLSGSTSGSVTLQEPAIAGTTVLDLPATSGNVVVDSATQTLTNKTLTSPTIGGTPTGVGVLTSGTAVASTSGTSIDFTGIPSWVKRITVLFQGVSTNGTSRVQVQIGSGSFTTSGYDSFISNIDGSSTSVGSITTGFGWRTSQTAASFTYGSGVLSLVSGNTWNMAMSTAQTSGFGSYCNGGITLGGVLDRVRLTTVNGTDAFDAGSINILYE
jgi:hypothetical protein